VFIPWWSKSGETVGKGGRSGKVFLRSEPRDAGTGFLKVQKLGDEYEEGLTMEDGEEAPTPEPHRPGGW